MITRFIGLKELRREIGGVADRARLRHERYIVLRKNEPIFELRPLSKTDATLEALTRDIAEAEADVKAGRVYSAKDVEKMLGL